MFSTEQTIEILATAAGQSRFEMWANIIQKLGAKTVLELGVLRGNFAEHILSNCASVAHYFMLDPWRHLDNWNKPANVGQEMFEEIYSLALRKTEFASDRRRVLRGTTTEMIEEISDESLDLAYIDADHTLRGIAIDLIRTYPKIKPGGIVGGDDYTRTIWQHPDNFEPTLVCPFASYFAEAHGCPLIILEHSQFAIVKPTAAGQHFQVIDSTRSYGPRALLWQVQPRS